MSEADNASEAMPTSIDPPDAALRTLRSEDLLRGAREVLIEHGKETYRLRLTKAGKLILNK